MLQQSFVQLCRIRRNLLANCSNCCLYQAKCFYQREVAQYLEKPFPDVYSQKTVESFWSEIWHQSQLFVDRPLKAGQKEFRLLLPPPNITGSLHLGHSLTVAIQDAICRYERLNGKSVKWFGGTDHAGIATQLIVEKILWTRERKSRHDVSREEFQKIFADWKTSRVEEIQRQLRSLGVSIDFESDYFTLSPRMSEIVGEAFIQLFNRNLIYRSSYMVNWSYYLQSTLSDIEIEHRFISKPTLYEIPGCEEKFWLGVLHYFKYPIGSPDSREFVRIATTRLESVMGDVGLCVNPGDPVNAHLIGKQAYNPFTRRHMPIVGDEQVKPDFGTGVLKLTPAHSLVDFEIAKRHGLAGVEIFDHRGFIDCPYEAFNGVHRYAAKELVRNELQRLGLYCEQREHPHWLPVCARSGDIIESKLVPQWFLKSDDARYVTEYVVNADNLSDESKQRWKKLKAKLDPKDRYISVTPSSYRNTWKDWFSRYQDWCISRQIFWGHRIPAYQVWRDSKPTDQWVAARSQEEAIELAREKFNLEDVNFEVKQDTDVLDTWFSSALLPLAVTGYFEGKTFTDGSTPLSLMETGHDIIFFWVARMVLLSLLISEIIPFDKILLHGMICDESGKKMSKSKGNVVDPMHVINGATLEQFLEQSKNSFNTGVISERLYSEILKSALKNWKHGLPVCGADVLRLSLLQSNFKQQNVKFNLNKTVKKRVFSNKMHQTIRFLMLNWDPNFRPLQLKYATLTEMDKWILTKLADLISLCRLSFQSQDLQYAAREVEKFWCEDLCNIYLECVKKDILEKSAQYRHSMTMLVEIIGKSLIVIHPYMPFITENLYQQLMFALARSDGKPFEYRSILDQSYPTVQTDSLLCHFDRSQMRNVQQMYSILQKIRWFRQNFCIYREPLIKRALVATHHLSSLAQYGESLQTLGKCPVEFVDLNDIYKYDQGFCIQVNVEEDSSSSSSDSEFEPRSNSLEMDEVYLVFEIDREELKSKLKERKLRKEKIESLLDELDSLHIGHFTSRYKKGTNIVN